MRERGTGQPFDLSSITREPPVDIIRMMREQPIKPCDPKEPPEFPGGAYSTSPYSTLVFRHVDEPIGLLAKVDEAVRSAGRVDTEVDNEKCTLRACAWSFTDSNRFYVYIYKDSRAAATTGVVYLAEFKNRNHCEDFQLPWRILRNSLKWLRDIGLDVAPVMSAVADGDDAMPAADEERPFDARESDVRPTVESVRSPYDDVRTNGCMTAASYALCTHRSVVGTTSCINAGLVAAVVDVITMNACGLESRTAATLAFVKWATGGMKLLKENLEACNINDALFNALRSYAEKPAKYTEGQLKLAAVNALKCLEEAGLMAGH